MGSCFLNRLNSVTGWLGIFVTLSSKLSLSFLVTCVNIRTWETNVVDAAVY